MSSTPIGRFWAVGVGPGDPEWLTLQAVRVLERVDVICHAGPEPRQGRAWVIVRQLVQPWQQIETLRTEPMPAITASEGASYRSGVERIAAMCRDGMDVAFITEGDPTLYSTAAAVWQLLTELEPRIPIEIVPGISAVSAAAARVGWSLARKGETLAIVPASYHGDALPEILERFTSVGLLKAAPVLPQVADALALRGSSCEAVYLENVGTDREWITRDLSAARERREYFAVVLVRRAARPGAPSPTPEDPGKLWIVGLGPGDPQQLTRQALEALIEAEVIVGYEGYLKLLQPLLLRAELIASPIGEEAQRAAQALHLAHRGRRVAVVSSGDAGVYGMASLVLELAEATPGLDIEIVPGVTAAVSAAALLGAPLGHDFACVSLSDLLTPWPVIERRLEAVGQGDFVLALYNPSSQRRTWQLPRARDILLKYRAPDTPVGLVERAYRPGMQVRHTTLAQLTVGNVSMETTLVIGSSQTRLVNGRLVTPRGYGTGA
jgi:precorrin-2 C20-methyltransferase/precorrin-3B C17-methyltransferase